MNLSVSARDYHQIIVAKNVKLFFLTPFLTVFFAFKNVAKISS